MEIAYLNPTDSRWQEALRRVPHDFYHLPQYCDLMQQYDGGRAEAVLATQGTDYFFMPYLVRSLSDLSWLPSAGEPLYDIVSPYGYPGPLFSAGGEKFLHEAIRCWSADMCRRNIICGFFRLHPLFPLTNGLSSVGELVQRGKTISIDLTLSRSELWNQLRENHRRDIQKKRRLGLTANLEDTEEAYQSFTAMYYETMQRVGASKYYFFPEHYFLNLKRALGEKLQLCIVRSSAGEPLGGGLFTFCDRIVQFHLGGTYNSALDVRPSKLMFDHLIAWSKDHGYRSLHLGGGFGAKEDSVYSFKAGFSPLRHVFHTWHICFAPDAYVELEEQRRAQPAMQPVASFFPIYRG